MSDDSPYYRYSSSASLPADQNNTNSGESSLIVLSDDLPPVVQKRKEEEAKPQSSSGIWMTIVALSIFSMLGNAFRVFLENLFGQSCETQTPTWLYRLSFKWNVCFTSSQTALFIDLPVNMIGSFVMGLFQPCQDIGLQSSVPIAFLKTKHWFQTSQVVHIAIRTGFCGSLTTFSSWNTSMLALMTNEQIVAALFGYIIGAYLSVSSLKLGQQTSIGLHRFVNPYLAKAEDLQYSSQHSPINQKVLHELYRKNRLLPDFERRYLDGLLSKQELQWVKQRVTALDALDQWKQTTHDHRTQPYRLVPSRSSNVSSSSFSNNPPLRPSPSKLMEQKLLTLQQIEHQIIVEREDPSENVLRVAREHGWDVDALKQWAEHAIEASNDEAVAEDQRKQKEATSSSRSATKKTMIVLWAHALLVVCLLTYFGYSSVFDDSTFYPSLLLSTILAPLGTLLRWWLSRFNGNLKGGWSWFPIGTFAANISASLVSALFNGMLIRYNNYIPTTSFTSISLRAIAIGFTGCLSTVSTFVTEYDKLNKTFPQHGKAAYYVIASLLTACFLGLAVYVPLIS
mmetsp:Transcript_21/g.39  ORF Transcript_21/g.39 Transcript_21/m.39 type:complete len:567 (+) Transcript_21:123-1823(+)